MGNGPIALGNRYDLAISASGYNVLTGIAKAKLTEPSAITIFLNRESVDVTAQILIGDREVYSLGPASVNATVGDMPIVPDDLIIKTTGFAGEEIQILGTNVNAAAQELGYLVQIAAISDVLTLPALAEFGR